jgi:hypothetical protein
MRHWLLRIGDGEHFNASSKKNIWGVDSSDICNIKPFLDSVISGDCLWFVKSKSKGKLVAVATFTATKKRETGPLIAFTQTNEELGWIKQKGEWDTEIHFKDMYNLTDIELLSEIKSPKVARLYNEKCKVNLPQEYPLIVKYSSVKKC